MAAPATVRPATEADLDRAGDVSFLAFYHVALAHGQRPAVTNPTDSRAYLRHLLRLDPAGGLVAERDGAIVGMAWVHARGPIATIGPVAVDPPVQGLGVGRLLLERAVEIAGSGVPQLRLVHESFNARSLGLYLRLGFRIVAPLLDLERPPDGGGPAVPRPAGVTLRSAIAADHPRIVARDGRAFGAPRPQSVDLHLRHGTACVAERGGTLAGYALGLGARGNGFLGSAAGDDPDTVLALAATVTAALHEQGQRVRTLVPATDRRLVDGLWALGFRVVRACHYMVRGGGTAPPSGYLLMNGDLM